MKLTGSFISAILSIAFNIYFPAGAQTVNNGAGGSPQSHLYEVGKGLKFNGNERYIDERTSYKVFRETTPLFRDELSISFDLQTFESSRMGYIMRIKDIRRQATYNISYDREGHGAVFKFNEEGRSTLMAAAPPVEQFDEYMWHRVDILFRMRSDSVLFMIDGREYASAKLLLPDNWAPEIYFGRSEHLIDVPSFAIRDLEIGDTKKSYFFPLDENCGWNVHNTRGKPFGTVINPVWLINNAYNWNLRAAFSSQSVSGSNIDAHAQKVYIFNRDSLTVFNIRSGEAGAYPFVNECPIDITLGTNFIDTVAGRIYVYEPYDHHSGQPTISVIDIASRSWEGAYPASLPRQLHHHSGIYDPRMERYLLFGGFGNLKYNGSLYSLDTSVMEWDTLKLGGTRIHPRYFQAAGYSQSENALYIFGGMGNESGDQVVGRRYYYDLHKIDLNSRSVSKLWEIPWTEENIVPVRGMVLDDSCFYTLCYPEHYSNSYLRLYKFRLDDGAYAVYGDSIPINSEKIKTNANLYYNPEYSELCAVVQEFEADDIASKTNIYTLSFPPVDRAKLSTALQLARDRKVRGIALGSFAALLVCSCLYYVWIWYRRKKRANMPLQIEDVFTLAPERANAVYLFGEFTVRDRNNRDISYMFSSKLRQLFLLILWHSREGISSRKMSEMIWPDKPEAKLKNLRGVTLNHLRKTLAELDGIQLVHDKSVFRLETRQPFYCDYLECMALLEGTGAEGLPKDFGMILARGKFLKFIDNGFFDSFKQSVERSIEPVLQKELTRSVVNRKFRTAVVLAEALFSIDPFDDNAIRSLVVALASLKMVSEARKRFTMFTSEFRDEMGEDYPLSFDDLFEQH